jgi:hypothetical protein
VKTVLLGTIANALLLKEYLNQKYLGVVVPLVIVYLTVNVSPTFNPVVGVTVWLTVICANDDKEIKKKPNKNDSFFILL